MQFCLKNPAKISPFVLVFMALFGLQNCKGAECAALSASTLDTDSDCKADASDNCPFTYNPLQRDTDDNSIGDECEDEEAIASLVSPDPETGLFIRYPKPDPQKQFFTPKLFKHQKNCAAYVVVGCQDQLVESFESAGPQSPLNDRHSTFGSLTGVCSAFNPRAPLPPALYCLSAAEQLDLVGYLSNNPIINKHLDPCTTLEALGIPVENCLPE